MDRHEIKKRSEGWGKGSKLRKKGREGKGVTAGEIKEGKAQ